MKNLDSGISFGETSETSASLVHILLACYNGRDFIESQIRSIQSQSHTNWLLLIRDDGSKDGTQAICAKFAECDLRIQFVDDAGGNLGVIRNFGELISRVRDHCGYVMFCDQDDVWHPDKVKLCLKAAICAEHSMRQDENGLIRPVLVHTDLRIVNEAGVVILPSLWTTLNWSDRCNRFSRLLVQNGATGCTVLVNRSLLARIDGFGSDVIMHDWWLALVAAAFGSIVALPTPTIDYRQHCNNLVGVTYRNPIAKMLLALKSIPAKRSEYFERPVAQAKLFASLFADVREIDCAARIALLNFIKLPGRGLISRKLRVITLKFWRHSVFATALLVLVV